MIDDPDAPPLDEREPLICPDCGNLDEHPGTFSLVRRWAWETGRGGKAAGRVVEALICPTCNRGG